MLGDHYLDWNWCQAHKSESRVRVPVLCLLRRLEEGPQDLIVSSGDRSVSVEEFAQMSATIAARLVADGDDTPVVVLVDRSLTSVASIAGIEWAGRCLIPVAFDEPQSRLEGIIARVGKCTVADATAGAGRTIPDHDVVHLSNLKSQWIDPVPCASDRSGMIVFTSGSTGQPKGVNWLGWQMDSGVYGYVDRHPYRTATFGPLQWLAGTAGVHLTMAGGHLRLVNAVELGPAAIMEDLRTFGVERMSMTSSLLHTLAAEADKSGPFDTLKEVRLAGEASTWTSVGVARSLSTAGVTVLSYYGASESMKTLALFTVGPDEPLQTGPLPLGELDRDLIDLVPVDGSDDNAFEIVAKRWVVDGYLGDPELNRQRFGIDDNGDPFWRAGDVVTVDDSGVLQFRGRSDDMMKVSGKLVEPSEATRVLEGCAGVRKVVVLPRALSGDRNQLVAHVEVEPGTTPEAVRATLKKELPAHLIPAIIMRHDHLPVTDRGKVNRQLLIHKDPIPWRSSTIVPPHGTLQITVVNEAASLLGLSQLSLDDDLWSLGLDSLGAIELSARLAAIFDSELTVNDFIGTSTPEDISRLLSRGRLARRSHVVPLVESDLPASMFVVTGAGSPAFRFRELAEGIAHGRSVIAYEQWGLMQRRRRPDRTVTAAAKRNLKDLLATAPTGPCVLIGHSLGGLIAHEMACQLREAGRDVALVLLDTGRSGQRVEDGSRPRRAPSRWEKSKATLAVRSIYRFLRRQIWRINARRRADHRFWLFFDIGANAARRHQPRVFDGPMLVVQVEGSMAAAAWQDQPRLRVVTSTGDHNSMCHAPHVNSVIKAIDAFLSEYQEAPTAT